MCLLLFILPYHLPPIICLFFIPAFYIWLYSFRADLVRLFHSARTLNVRHAKEIMR